MKPQIAPDDVEDVKELSVAMSKVLHEMLSEDNLFLNLSALNVTFFQLIFTLVGKEKIVSAVDCLCEGLKESAAYEAARDDN